MKVYITWILALGIISLIAIFIFSNNLRGKFLYYWKYLIPTNLLPVNNVEIESNGNYTNIVFLHHSVGSNLIKEGKLRDILSKRGYSFWDHGYNSQGLVDPRGEKLNLCYDIPSSKIFGIRGGGNTDPLGLNILFNQSVDNPPNNAFSRLLQHEVIMFKSCYPNSGIKSRQMLDQYKKWFLNIRKIIDQHPNKIFITFTLPPLHPLATNPDDAKRAREWANWLKSHEYTDGHPNIFVFDFFDLLADSSTHMLAKKYQRDPNKPDSHPNTKANMTIGPILVEFIDNAIKNYIEVK